jgi:hypothetical protein
MKFNHQIIALTEEEQNVLAGAVYFKGKKVLLSQPPSNLKILKN